MARIMPPPRGPLEPVAGIVKLIIWAAKINAPRTPIIGTLCSSRFFLSFLALKAVRPAAAGPKGPPPAGGNHAPGRGLGGISSWFCHYSIFDVQLVSKVL